MTAREIKEYVETQKDSVFSVTKMKGGWNRVQAGSVVFYGGDGFIDELEKALKASVSDTKNPFIK